MWNAPFSDLPSAYAPADFLVTLADIPEDVRLYGPERPELAT
jgi:hypothetical protein